MRPDRSLVVGSNKATGILNPTQASSYAGVPKEEGAFEDFRFSGTDVNQYGMHHGPLRRLDLFGGATTDRIPTPFVPGGCGYGTVRWQCPIGRTPLWLGT